MATVLKIAFQRSKLSLCSKISPWKRDEHHKSAFDILIFHNVFVAFLYEALVCEFRITTIAIVATTVLLLSTYSCLALWHHVSTQIFAAHRKQKVDVVQTLTQPTVQAHPWCFASQENSSRLEPPRASHPKEHNIVNNYLTI